jgi:hypothetical protein
MPQLRKVYTGIKSQDPLNHRNKNQKSMGQTPIAVIANRWKAIMDLTPLHGKHTPITKFLMY